MKYIMNLAFIGMLALSTTAFASGAKPKAPAKKAHTTQTCGPNCPHPCPPGCTGGSCCKK